MKLNIKKMIKGSLISLAVLGMIGGSLNIPNVNARQRYRTHRVYSRRAKVSYKFGYWKNHRYYHYKTGYFRNGHWVRKTTPTKRTDSNGDANVYYLNGHTYHNKLAYEIDLYDTNNQYLRHHRNDNENKLTHSNVQAIATNLAEFKAQTVIDINKDRQEHHLAPLKETPELDKFANERADQLESNYNHTTKGSINSNYYSENIDETRQGPTSISDEDGKNPLPVLNRNGYDMANTENYNFMDHDAPEWGHRVNLLDPTLSEMGVGVSYGHSSSNSSDNEFPYKLAEDFLPKALCNNN